MGSILGTGNLVLEVIFLIFAIVWMFVPFTVLAIRRLLVQLVQKQEEANNLLRTMSAAPAGRAYPTASEQRDRPTI